MKKALGIFRELIPRTRRTTVEQRVGTRLPGPKTYLHCESKKGTSVFLSITVTNINRFSNFFTAEFGNKFATK